ncbi:MAG: hypothetical protein PWP55_1284 [Clostridiales bacterium]|nr:hypothetical protein [Clostridiales bacterium]
MKKDIIASLIVIWLTVASVCAITTVNRFDITMPAVASGDTMTVEPAPALAISESLETSDELKSDDTVIHEHETEATPQADNNVDESPSQEKATQKIDVKETIESYENMLAAWFEKDAADELIEEPAPLKPDNTKTVATLAQLDEAKGSVSVKDKLEVAKLLAKVDINDIKKMADMAVDGVTLQEARDMDKILKNHLSTEEVKKLEAVAKSYVK